MYVCPETTHQGPDDFSLSRIMDMKYETLHQAIRPVQLNNPFFIRKENGEVETRFLVIPPEKKDVTVFPTQIAMLQQVLYVGEDGL